MRLSVLAKIALTVLTCSALGLADDWSKQFTVSGAPQLRLRAQDANIHLSRRPGKDVSVVVHTAGMRIADDAVRISATQSGDIVNVQIHEPSVHINLFTIHRHSIEVEIGIPEQALIEVKTGDGNIDLDDISGQMRLESGDGHIVGRALDGRLDCKTGDGHVEVEGRFNEMRIDTGDGHVMATVRSGSKLASSWNIHTGDGSVELRVPSDLAADLDLHTGDGHIRSDFPVEVQGQVDRSHLQGRINGGGPVLQVRTGDGSITLTRSGSTL